MIAVLLLITYLLGGLLMEESLSEDTPYKLLQILGWPLMVAYRIVRVAVMGR